ncbi:hypothetical protein D6T64_06885 [Cryobacterium melibiosiphilum]|uniref:Uncharacterized protein n=2 Tax=Cryobacterium melibiosiphilum TaxID=995039 RepID=A0A3A5MW63_9MICO|nr:hypothetical protein D6T64_09850 [Cryobacterium melibiosiphilum]RJT89444.1 hypothetical protein D6T64_06885 [Cryobacterium melibiosiphilum]
MTVLAAVAVIGLIADPRTVTGLLLWSKPLKFALSITIYAVTLSWLIGQLQRGRRLAWWAGTVSAVLLLVEMIIIVGAALAGTTSHFNVATPFATTMWAIMATSIAVVWVAALVVAVLLMRARLGDRARTLAIRAGVVIAVIGMGLGYLMTGPTAEQLDDFQGIAGAHTVGLADGGPGLPILGWSTVAGDLRIPHFVGMHALQLLPLAAVLFELLARRMPRLQSSAVRARLLGVLIALYAGVLVLLTGQALAGQSIVRPDATTLTIAVTLYALAAVAATIILARQPRRGVL